MDRHSSTPITLLPLTQAVDRVLLEESFPDSIVVCDAYVAGIEQGEEVPGGYVLGRVTNVDHHAATPRMQRFVSSANLAIERVTAVGAATRSESVVINHTDCDSILSSGIISGRLDPEPRFGASAIAADHTGDEDDVADLLQALDEYRDVELSFRSLDSLRSGEPLDRAVHDALERRRARRRAVMEFVMTGGVRTDGPVALAVLDGRLDGEFFAPLVRDAAIILLAYPNRDDSGTWHVKVRLGLGAPAGVSLHMLNIEEFDASYGGRWNAGSNRRGGGTTLDPDGYARRLAERLASLWESPRSP